MAIFNSYVKLPEGTDHLLDLPSGKHTKNQKAIEHGPFIVSFPITNGYFP